MKRIQKCMFRYHELDIFSCIVAMGEQFVPKALHITQPKNAGCMEGTREEVLEKFLSWVMRDPNRIFWLAGLAGMGKTSIALTLCRLLQYEPQVILGGAFFCSRTSNKEERTDPSRILPTLATIMAEQSPEFAAAMDNELGIGANPHAAFQPAKVQAESLLCKPLASLSIPRASYCSLLMHWTSVSMRSRSRSSSTRSPPLHVTRGSSSFSHHAQRRI